MWTRPDRHIARRQHGLFHRDQAYQCGFTARQVRLRVLSGQWRAVFRSVFVVAEHRLTPSLTDRAAHLAVPGSVLAGPSAAPYHGLTVPRAEPHLIVSRRTRPRAGMRLLVEQLSARDIRLLDGLVITSPERTLLDCVLLLPDGPAVELLDRGLQRGVVTLDQLATRARERVGRPGAPRLARLVGAMAVGTRSAAERRLAHVLRRHQGWRANAEIRSHRELIAIGDIVFEHERVVLEADGLAFHVDPASFQRDRDRQNRLVAAGWTVLRFTWRDLTERPESVVDTVSRILACHPRQPGPTPRPT